MSRCVLVQYLTRTSLVVLSLLILLLPVSSFAQTKPKSSRYILDDASFAGLGGLLARSRTPQITVAPQVLEIAYDRAVIRWETDTHATSAVEYGVDTDYGLERKQKTLTPLQNVTITG